MSSIKTLLLVAVVAAISGGIGFWWAAHKDMVQNPYDSGSAASIPPPSPPAEKKVLYWYDPMVPNQHFDKPGKSPFMDMDLVPKNAESTGMTGVVVSTGIQQNLALRRAKVERKTISRHLEVVGEIDFDQRNVAVVQTRTGGFVERVYPHAIGDVVERNSPLADLLLPDWTAAQLEFLALENAGDAELLAAARSRMHLLGMSDELIRSVEKTRKPQSIITVTSPIAGMIQAINVRNGMSISMGVTLAEIVGIDPVWLKLAVPESQAEFAKVGQALTVNLSAYPGEKFSARVISILPNTNSANRTLELRAELPNSDLRLRPGMYAKARIDTDKEESQLWVPMEAVIRSGTRDVILVDNGPGGFLPTEVELGPESGGKIVILHGLEEGQTIITSGQFLIDSEANLIGALKKLDASQSEPESSANISKDAP